MKEVSLGIVLGAKIRDKRRQEGSTTFKEALKTNRAEQLWLNSNNTTSSEDKPWEQLRMTFSAGSGQGYGGQAVGEKWGNVFLG